MATGPDWFGKKTQEPQQKQQRVSSKIFFHHLLNWNGAPGEEPRRACCRPHKNHNQRKGESPQFSGNQWFGPGGGSQWYRDPNFTYQRKTKRTRLKAPSKGTPNGTEKGSRKQSTSFYAATSKNRASERRVQQEKGGRQTVGKATADRAGVVRSWVQVNQHHLKVKGA